MVTSSSACNSLSGTAQVPVATLNLPSAGTWQVTATGTMINLDNNDRKGDCQLVDAGGAMFGTIDVTLTANSDAGGHRLATPMVGVVTANGPETITMSCSTFNGEEGDLSIVAMEGTPAT